MRFLSKLTFICNLCFIATVIILWYENAHKQKGNFTGLIKLQPLESTLAILGYGAIFVNLIFNIALLIGKISGVKQSIAKWIMWFNFLLLLLQIYYFFFSK